MKRSEGIIHIIGCIRDSRSSDFIQINRTIEAICYTVHHSTVLSTDVFASRFEMKDAQKESWLTAPMDTIQTFPITTVL